MNQTVPDITAVEPVYPDGQDDRARWVTCTLEWDPERGKFVNKEAETTWKIDEAAIDNVQYIVGGEEYSSLQKAMDAAVRGTDFQDTSPTVVIEPDEDKSPEWGDEV